MILAVQRHGQVVQLDDASHWEVKMGDSTKSHLWMTSQRVVVTDNDNQLYPHKLKNLDTQDEVEARKIS